MGKYIKGANRYQIMLFPPSIDEFISDNNEVRIIDAFVNNLDLVMLGFKFAVPNSTGAPSYDPSDLLKIYIYSYPKKIRSSRKIAAELNRNIELIWLVGGIKPDFRTISDFRKDNILPIKKVLKEFNKLCLDLNVFSRELASLDGSKFKAVNSKDNNFTKDKLKDRLTRLNVKVEAYLDALNYNDGLDLSSEDKIDISDKLKKAQDRALLYNQYLNTIADSGENQLSLTDKDSRLMKCNNSMLVGFNAQMTVDTKSHIITSVSASNKPNDNGCMCDMGKNAKDAFEVDQIEQLADGGYVDNVDIKNCFENKIVPILPDGIYSISWDYNKHDISDDIKKGNSKDDIIKCFESGIIPDCYSYLNMNIDIVDSSILINTNAVLNEQDEFILKAKANDGFFVRNRLQNIVYCPYNNVLNFKKSKQNVDIFIGNSDCLTCPNKCTKHPVREVELFHYEDLATCGTFKRKFKPIYKEVKFKKVIVTYIPDKIKYKLRKNTSEHPFGTLKRHHDFSYFLLKGLDKIEGELVLSVLGYNIKRLINLIGTEKLINYLNNKNKPIFND